MRMLGGYFKLNVGSGWNWNLLKGDSSYIISLSNMTIRNFGSVNLST